jgi:hypothetical protein
LDIDLVGRRCRRLDWLGGGALGHGLVRRGLGLDRRFGRGRAVRVGRCRIGMGRSFDDGGTVEKLSALECKSVGARTKKLLLGHESFQLTATAQLFSI